MPPMHVSQALRLAEEAVNKATPVPIWVTGTVTDLRRAPAGHLYCKLADNQRGTGTTVTLSVVVFAKHAPSVTNALAEAGFELRNGLAIALQGTLDLWEATGQVQLKATAIDPAVTVGKSVLTRQRLLEQLRTSGQLARQKALPEPLPLTIGMVGPEGAGVNDVVEILRAAGPDAAYHVYRYRVISSGPKAAYSIAATITAAGRNPELDLILVTRGGGASSELTAYDSEAVARAICECPVPVYTALGHSTDSTVADQCACRVAHTPSDAAQALIIEPVARAYNELRTEAQHIVNLASEMTLRAGRELTALWDGIRLAHEHAVRTTISEAQHLRRLEAQKARNRSLVIALAALAAVLFLILLLVLINR